MAFLSRGRSTLLVAAVLLIGLAVHGGWGNVGVGDGALYRTAAACAESTPGAVMIKRCFHPSSTAALFPTLVLGISARITGAALGSVVRFYGMALGLFVLLMVWHLSRGRQDKVGGAIAVWSLIVATPLVDRVRSGGVEVWILALSLLLAKLLADSRETFGKAVFVMVVALLLFATHPYTACALVGVLFLPMCTRGPDEVKKRDGHVWFGWFGVSHLAAVLGGVALFSIIWPGFQGGRQLWQRLVGLFRNVHPPFRFDGEIWVKALEVSAPRFYTTTGVVLLSTSVVVVVLVIMGILAERREEDVSRTPLLLLASAWLVVNSLQGSPFADGYDQRLPLLGLLIPFVGRGYGVFERYCADLVPWPSRARAIAIVAVLVGLSANTVATFQGRLPASGLAPDSGAMVQMGGSAFMRPVFEPGLLEMLRGLPNNTKLACSPWGEPCRRDIVPGINALSLEMPRLRAARFFDADVVVIPNDPAYITPPVLLQDFSGDDYRLADIYQGAWLRYAVRKTQSVAQAKPTGSLPR